MPVLLGMIAGTFIGAVGVIGVLAGRPDFLFETTEAGDDDDWFEWVDEDDEDDEDGDQERWDKESFIALCEEHGLSEERLERFASMAGYELDDVVEYVNQQGFSREDLLAFAASRGMIPPQG